MLPVPDSPPARSAEVVLSPELEPSISPFNHHSAPFSSALSIQNLVPSSSEHEIIGSLDTVFSGLGLELLTSSAGDGNSAVSNSVPGLGLNDNSIPGLGPDDNSIPGLGPDDNYIPGLGPDEISTSDLELIENDSGDNDSIINQPSQSEMIDTEQSAPETLAPSKRSRGRPRTRPLPDPNAPKRPRGRPKKYSYVQNPLDNAGSAMSNVEMTGEESSANKQKKYKQPQLRDPDAPRGPAFTSVSAWVSSASIAPQSPPPSPHSPVAPVTTTEPPPVRVIISEPDIMEIENNQDPLEAVLGVEDFILS